VTIPNLNSPDQADDAFAPEFIANKAYAENFELQGLTGIAGRGLAVLTCMDSRIEPLQMLGLGHGDAKILRNAGARVTDDVLRTLILSVHLLNVNRILVVPHLRCRMTGSTEEQMHQALSEASGMDTRSLELHPTQDVRETLLADVQRIRSSPYLPADTVVGGAIYDVDTGLLERIL
jgi:carbonic anhydrase